MEKFRELLRKYRFLVNIVVLTIGVLLLFIAKTIKPENSEETFINKEIAYDIVVGIGCSITSTAGITLFLLALLPDDVDSEKSKELDQWGIQYIHRERRDIAIAGNNLPRKQLDYIAFGLKHFRDANAGKNSDLVKRVRKGLNIRIITLHPESRYVLEQQNLEKRDEINSDIKKLHDWKDEILGYAGSSCKGSIEIKYYNNLPLDFYCRADNRVFIGPYMPGRTSGANITYEFKTEDTEGGKYYTQIFEDLWNEKILNYIELSTHYLIGNQALAIEKTLEHFCKEFAGSNGGDKIIGIVVMFKEQNRRTLFSCNKKGEERHVCHSKDKGIVGRMVSLNKDSSGKEEILFEDFKNRLSFVSYQSETTEGLQRIEFLEQAENDNLEKIKAILAIPIIDNYQLIGAITFDFFEFPLNYEKQLNQLMQFEGNQDLTSKLKDLEIGHWFRLAKSCRQIIQPMLGSELKLQYKSLFEEEWSNGSSKAV